MSKTLAELVALLQSEVPAVNSVPSSAQYTQAIKDAVQDFSRLCGVRKFSELSIVSGTATYALADDFLKLIWLEALTGVDGVIVSSGGLIPTAAEWDEVYSIMGGSITFTPTPTYTLNREYSYKAAWTLTGAEGSEAYATLGDAESQIVMLKAKALAKSKQRQALSSGGGMNYSMGVFKVDKSSGVEDLKSDISSLNDEYDAACDAYNGAVFL